MDTYDQYRRGQEEASGAAPVPGENMEPAPQADAVRGPQATANPAPAAAPVEPAPVWEPVPPVSQPYHYAPIRDHIPCQPAAPSFQAGMPEADRPAPSRKPSPYANSPYVINPPAGEYTYQPQTRPEPKKPREKKKRNPWRGILSAVLVLALVVGSCALTASTLEGRMDQQALRNQQTIDQLNQRINDLQQQLEQQASQPAPSGVPATGTAGGSGMTPAQVYYNNVSSVVAISVSVGNLGSSAGSGFIISEDGYVVTNYHVVEGGSAVSVILNDGTEYAAKVVGYDAPNDVALLKAEATGLTPVRLGSSTAMNVGDMVVAIGNPLGELNSTQTVGYICGKDREITTGGTIINMLQTDAAINPGNSGGPLFNMNGEVVGITTAKYSGTTSSGASIEGIGFAIPIDDVLGILSDLQTFGYVTGAYLGVVVQNVDASVSSAYGISGAYVISVEPGYAAARGGVQAKDIIIGVDGHEVGNITDLTRILRNYKAGDTITLHVIRSGIQKQLTVTLDEKPQDLQQPTATPDEEEMPEGDYEEWYDYFRRHFGE